MKKKVGFIEGERETGSAWLFGLTHILKYYCDIMFLQLAFSIVILVFR